MVAILMKCCDYIYNVPDLHDAAQQMVFMRNESLAFGQSAGKFVPATILEGLHCYSALY
jgi:hypothetical protein